MMDTERYPIYQCVPCFGILSEGDTLDVMPVAGMSENRRWQGGSYVELLCSVDRFQYIW